VVHANAVLTPRGRLCLPAVSLMRVGRSPRAAEHFHVSWPTATTLGRTVCGDGPGRYGRSLEPATSQPESDT